MIEEFTPEIIWIAALGAGVVFGLMMAVWYVSTRGDDEKKKPSTSPSSMSTVTLPKLPKKKKQYGSPRKKKDVDVNETSDSAQVNENDEVESEVPSSVNPLPNNEGGKPKESPWQQKSKKWTTKSRSQEMKVLSTDHSLSSDRPLTNTSPNDRHQTIRSPPDRPQTIRSPPDRPQTIRSPPDRPTICTSTDRSSNDLPSTTLSKKTKAKAKQQQSSSKDENINIMPGSQIVQAVANSTLSDEEVQLVMEKLLEKQDEEWEATGRGDSVKSLKKTNEDLVTRCQEAEKSAKHYTQRVKEIGAELKQEKSRLMNSEKAFQVKLGKQQEDIDNLKKKVQLYKEEVEMLKNADSDPPHVDETNRLEEANQAIKNQLSQLTSEKSKATNQVKELVDAKKQLSQKLTKETEKLAAVQIEKKNVHEELVYSRNEIKKLEQDVSALCVKVQSLQSKLSVSEDTLAKERQTSDKENKELLNAGKQEHVLAMQELQEKHLLEINELKLQTQLKFEDIKADMSHLEAEKNDKEEQINVLNNENVALKEELKATKSELLNVTEHSTKMNGQQQEVVGDNTQNNVLEEEIAELKKENTALQEKVIDLKTKNNTLRDKSWKARDEQEVTIKECDEKLKTSEIEHKKQMQQLRQEAAEEHLQQMVFLNKLFPKLPGVEGNDFYEWISQAQACISEKLTEMEEESENKKKTIEEMTKQVEEGSQLTNELKEALSDTLSKLEDLMKKWEEKEKRYNDTILQEELRRNQMEKDVNCVKENLEKLTAEYNSCKLQCEFLEKEKESFLQKHEEIILQSQKCAETLQEETALKDTATKGKQQVEARLKQAEEDITRLTDKNETLTKNLAQVNTDVTELEAKLKESEALAESLRNANQDLNQRLQVKFSPPPIVSTSSDV